MLNSEYRIKKKISFVNSGKKSETGLFFFFTSSVIHGVLYGVGGEPSEQISVMNSVLKYFL